MTVEMYTDQPNHVPEQEPNPDFEYKLLVGHTRTDGSPKSTEQLHTEYVGLTDGIVHEIVDGVDVTDPTTGETVHEKVDYVVWLDKSARPVAWLTRELWPLLAADKDGNVPEEPQHRFVNIDRNQWTSTVDPNAVGSTDVSKVDQSIIRSLRSIFLADPNDRKDGLTTDIDTAPTQFDGKTVLIVDEVNSSGRTLRYAEGFFKRAFPEAKVAGTHWMAKMATRKVGKGEPAVGNADLPVWYSDTTDVGRGVGNRNVDLSLTREGAGNVQRLGAWFLSVGLGMPDPRSTLLREELHQLAEDAKNGKVFIDPSGKRDLDDQDERGVRLNHLDSVEQFLEQKKLH